MLKLKVRPEGKIFVDGRGWIKNAGKRPIEVVVSDGVGAQREKRIEELAEQIYHETGFALLGVAKEKAWMTDREDVRQRFRELAQEKIRGSRIKA